MFFTSRPGKVASVAASCPALPRPAPLFRPADRN